MRVELAAIDLVRIDLVAQVPSQVISVGSVGVDKLFWRSLLRRRGTITHRFAGGTVLEMCV